MEFIVLGIVIIAFLFFMHFVQKLEIEKEIKEIELQILKEKNKNK